MNTPCETNDLLVFSPMRWDNLYQRPQQIFSRFAKFRRVFYFEDPVFGMTEIPRLHIKESSDAVQIVIPYLPDEIKLEEIPDTIKQLVDELIFDENIQRMTLWYYTPDILPSTRHLNPESIIYDCIDLRDPGTEEELLSCADLVFTSNSSLYDLKKHSHPNIHALLDSIDYAHFSQARLQLVEPDDLSGIPRPRIGVVNNPGQQLDIDLMLELAHRKPEYQFVVLGVPESNLKDKGIPENLHFLGDIDYHSLPVYVSSWDCALAPTPMDSVSKTKDTLKILEYPAGGRPVVTSPWNEFINFQSAPEIIHLANTADEYLAEINTAMNKRSLDPEWITKVDLLLSNYNWKNTFREMARLESSLFDNLRTSENQFESISSIRVSSGGII